LDGGAKKKMMEKAVFHYQKAAERHPYEPVAPLNLASVFTRMEDYNQASVYFKQARRLGFSRDYWLKINLKQINMERLWARDLWGKKDYDGSKRHYSRAIDLLHESSRGYQWERVYLVVVIEYARLLDERKEFNVADELFKKAESELPPYVISSLDHNIRREIGEHYLKKAKYLWYNRKTEEAYLNFKKSEFHLGIHGSLLKGEEDKLWSELSSEVKKTIEFLQRAGIDG
ncbi:MAG: tetratricopeptide repeat protein, partial [Akkermansiaceae bacterium]